MSNQAHNARFRAFVLKRSYFPGGSYATKRNYTHREIKKVLESKIPKSNTNDTD